MQERVGPESAADADQQGGDPLAPADRVAGRGATCRRSGPTVRGVVPDERPTGPPAPHASAAERSRARPPVRVEIEDRHQRHQAEQDDPLRQVVAVARAERVGPRQPPPSSRAAASMAQPRRSGQADRGRCQRPGPSTTACQGPERQATNQATGASSANQGDARRGTAASTLLASEIGSTQPNCWTQAGARAGPSGAPTRGASGPRAASGSGRPRPSGTERQQADRRPAQPGDPPWPRGATQRQDQPGRRPSGPGSPGGRSSPGPATPASAATRPGAAARGPPTRRPASREEAGPEQEAGEPEQPGDVQRQEDRQEGRQRHPPPARDPPAEPDDRGREPGERSATSSPGRPPRRQDRDEAHQRAGAPPSSAAGPSCTR